MLDQGRFILEGIPFSWFMDQKSALNVHSLLYGDINIELEPAADAEHAAYHAAKQLLLLEALVRRGAGPVVTNNRLIHEINDRVV